MRKKSEFLVKKSENPYHLFQKCHFCNFQTKSSYSAEHILKLKNLKSAKNLKSLMPVRTLPLQGISELEFFDDLVYKFRNIAGKSRVLEEFKENMLPFIKR